MSKPEHGARDERGYKTRYEEGMATRRSVLGDAHVDRAETAKTEFDRALPGTHHGSRMEPSLVKGQHLEARAVDDHHSFACSARS